MKAWGIASRQAGTLPEIFEVEKPVPAPGSVLVEVKGSSLNQADIKVLTGKNGGKFLHAGRFPLFLGFDFSGTVVQSGPGLPAPGEEVYGFLPYSMKTTQGAFSQYLAADARGLAPKPSGTSFAEAASLGTVASTALQALRDLGKMKAGQKLLVNGASGGVGTVALQIAKILGLEVWGICGAKNLDYIRQLGADKVLDYQSTFIGDLPEKFDVVFDVFCNSRFSTCSRVMTPQGVYIVLLPTPAFMGGYLQSLFSPKTCRFLTVQPKKADLELIAQWVGEGRLKPCVDSTFGFNEVPQALQSLQKQSPRGKIALSFE